MAKSGPDRRPPGQSAGAAQSLVRVLLDRAQTRAEDTAYEFLHSDGSLDAVTYGALYERAAATAARLADLDDRSGPVMLLYPPGLGFVTALWGCMLAGAPAVPAYPPLPQPGNRTTDRFRHILGDVRPAGVLVDPLIRDILPGIEGTGPLPPLLSPALDGSDATAGPHRTPALPSPDSPALIQYTSGSTNDPKGVVLRHANLMHNVRAISDVFGLDTGTRSVSWLPPYHDMGLIGCILTPLYRGFPMRLMSPLDFLKSPLVWLRQISELGVTATGGPNFAYDLCVRRAGNDALEGLDLSSWRVAFNGAEPVRQGTLEAFSRRFAPHGFRPSAFLPCYGLAEATLIVSGRHWDPSARSAEAGTAAEGRVSCGPVVSGTQLAVVGEREGEDGGVEHTALPEGAEGEIWLRGPGLTSGYWGRPADRDDELFGHLAGVRYLRTGDLGRLHDGELFVTGRSKDVLVHRGVNHHAHDIEAAALTDNPDVRPTAAAFMVGDADPAIALAVERSPARAGDDEQTAQGLRTRVLERTGVRLDTVVLCPPRAIPKTTSGKVQRRLTRDRFLAGELNGAVIVGGPVTAGDAEADGAARSLAQEPLGAFLAGVFAGVCAVPECRADQRLAEIGGDSIRAAEIAAITEGALGLPVGVAEVLDRESPGQLAAHLLDTWAGQGVGAAEVVSRLTALPAGEAVTAGTNDAGSVQ
ncbi:long-chain fatty acid--CoA ligase [Streptomyces piniterrae]|uniref:Long-chain fatty acid--CoA ligase n=1 Tax=Streptomyces piniterrae TaxID=2571125 RepID=A0A4U0MTF9_9ACTN|nr:long-chain fatty acid--CoA ligase [Streptomyces piniterrae]